MQELNMVLNLVLGYLASVDWSVILTFILLAFTFNHFVIRNCFRAWSLQLATRFRVLLVGLCYTGYFLLLFGFSQELLLKMSGAIATAIVLHQFLIEPLLGFLPSKVLRHFRAEKEDLI